MIRAIFVSVLIVVCSFVGGVFMLTAGAITIAVLDDSEPTSAVTATSPVPTQKATPGPSAGEPTPAAAEASAEAETAAKDARRGERAQARAEEGKRIAAVKAAERATAEKAEKAAAEKEAAEKEVAEKEAAEKAAAEEKAAEEKAAEEKAAEEKAAEEKAAEEKKAAEDKAAAGEWVTVVAIVDGDTVDVSSGARIRIAGIDTPERGECGYEEAGARMMELARDREAVLVKAGADSIDRYGRLIRYLDVDGRDVGLTLI